MSTARIAHPFPSVLDGLVTGLVALVAVDEPLTALRLGLSMTALQVSIGILNDLIDAPNDGGRTPPKPIPAGFVSPGAARIATVGVAALGLGLAVPSGAPTVALALVVLGIGAGYDQFAKGTAWSWLPFAVGIPLLPVYGWLGATGELPAFFTVLVPVAMLAGAALAIANAAADRERDEAAGVDSIVRRLGRAGAWRLHAVLFVVVVFTALATLVATGAQAVAITGAGVGGAVILLGVGLGREGGGGVGQDRGRDGDPALRQRAWEVEAIGSAVLAVAWVAGVTALRGPGVG